MSYITASEIELLTFFEVEPIKLDPNDPWVYNDSAYHITKNDFSLSFAIQPAYKDLRIILKHREIIMYELNARSILDLTYCIDRDKESLHIKITEHDELWLSVKPEIQFRHVYDNPA